MPPRLRVLDKEQTTKFINQRLTIYLVNVTQIAVEWKICFTQVVCSPSLGSVDIYKLPLALASKTAVIKPKNRSRRKKMKKLRNYVGRHFALTRSMAPWLLAVVAFAGWAVPASSQTDEPGTVDVDIPFELRAPWYNPDHTEIEDEVLLLGTLHVTARLWTSGANHIDRVALHANAVDIHGTSETTGQRFRLNGSFSIDLRDPEVTFNADGSFTLPPQRFSLRLHKVDPEPAILQSNLDVESSWAMFLPGTSPPPVPCQRRTAPDGTATAFLDCGNFAYSWYTAPVPYAYRVLAGGGGVSGCTLVVGNLCAVPDGSILFNGYAPTDAYRPPLILDARIPSPGGADWIVNTRLRWYCKTGSREAPVFSIGGGEFMGCRPIYSSTEPITVYADITYQSWMYTGYNKPMVLISRVVREAPFTFRMLERPMDQPPVIQSFSIQAESRSTGRCAPGQLCELADGDILFNTQAGDYNPPLNMRLTASDPEGDPIIVQWYCKSGSFFAPITDLGFGQQYRCSPGYIFPDSILIYASVSDGNNVVWSQQRQLYMLEFIH